MSPSDKPTAPGGLWSRFCQFVQTWYFQYELVTALYAMEPTEKIIINTVVVLVLSLFFLTVTSWLYSQVTTIIAILDPPEWLPTTVQGAQESSIGT